jgi:hypothetical protein
MAGNKTLTARNRAALDEWYTELTDIEDELRHYRDQFKGKVVLCNCDDPYESNFFKYFSMNFNHLGLKRLITTCYNGSPISGKQLPLLETAGLKGTRQARQAYKVVITEVPDLNGDGATDLTDVEYLLRSDANVMTPLKGDGDFRSDECLRLLDEADIVVTNPPWSLIRDFIPLIAKHEKQFLVIGDQNFITYREIFDQIMADNLWFGYNNGGTKWFRVPDDYEIATESRKKIVDGVKYFSMGRAYWFTNLDTTKRHQPMTLFKRYSPEEYPTYVNYPAIEVSKVSEIPMDYEGEMGVPITFLDKYSPEQFKIVGNSKWLGRPMSEFAAKGTYEAGGMRFYVPDGDGQYRRLYERIVIKRIGAAS